MSFIEALDIAVPQVDARLSGRAVDRPRPGDRTHGAGVELLGWVLGKDRPAIAVEVLHEGWVIRRLPLNHRRPDLAVAFPTVVEAATAGFMATVDGVGLGEMTFELHAVLADQTRVPFATLRLARRWRDEPYHPSPALVSVVIPCYNQARFLPEVIESVAAQSYPHLEVVIVDDGSHDNTAAVAGRYPGVRVVHQANAGVSAARNAGLRATNGAYILFIDADDRLLFNAVADGLAAFEAQPDAAFVAGRCRVIDIDGKPSSEQPPEHLPEQEHFLELLQTNFIWMPGTVLYRRAIFESVGVFDSDVDPTADYDMYLRIARAYPIRCHDGLVGEYRRHDGSMSSDPKRMFAAIVSTLRKEDAFVTGNPRLAEARQEGLRRWRAHYGRNVIEEVAPPPRGIIDSIRRKLRMDSDWPGTHSR